MVNLINLVKWAGGKAILAPNFESHFELQENCFYVEPFIGGGGSFLHLKKKFGAGADMNPSLIYLWEMVKNDLNVVTDGYAYYHELHSEGGYENARNIYNDLIKDIGKFQMSSQKKEDIAILFLYLLNASYNGLCRYSKKTGFNVPMGDKIASVRSVREKLLIVRDRIENTAFHCWDFEETIKYYQRKGNVFFYCDPPYSKINGKGFQSYIGDWQDNDADRLKKVLSESGCRFAVSEIDCPAVRERYEGCRLIELKAKRSIGGNRSKVDELLIVNF